MPLDSQSVFWVPTIVEYLSVMVGVLTGCLCACRLKFDVVGCITLGFITGFGGGILRDLLMGAQDIYFMQYPSLIWISLAISLVTFYFRSAFLDLDFSIIVADIITVALFVLAGCNKAYQAGLDGLYVVMMGVITGVAGGVLRDAISGQTPALFKASNFYALAALAGAVAYELLAMLGAPLTICGIVCLVLVVAVRLLSLKFDWQTTPEADLMPQVEEAAHKLASSVKHHGSSPRKEN